MKKTAVSDTAVLAEDLRTAVGRFVRSLRDQSGTASTAQSEVLAQVERGGPATVTALALLRSVKHQSMRLVVSRLVEQGALEMLPNPDDGRSQLVALTRAGRSQLKTQQSARADYLASLLESKLSADERQLLGKAVGVLNRLSSAD